MDAIATYSRLGGRIQTFGAWLQEQRAASPMSEYGPLRPWVNANLWLCSFMTAGLFALVVAELDAIILLLEKMNSG